MRTSSGFLTLFCSGIVLLLNLIVLAGWHFNLVELRSVISGTPQTMPLTALMLLSLAVSLACSRSLIDASPRSWPACVCGLLSGVVTLLSFWVLLEYVFKLEPQIDLWLYRQKMLALEWTTPGRPAPHTLVSLLLLGFSIGLSPFPGKIIKHATLILTLAAATIPWVALFGYVSGVNSFYSLSSNPKVGMALITAFSLFLLCLGQMSLRPAEGLLRSSSSGGLVSRILLPVTFGIPLLFSALVRWCSQKDLFESSFGLALIFGVSSLLFSGLVVWIAFLLNHRELEREKTDKEREKLLAELEHSLLELHNLQHGLITVCSWSKQVMSEGQWVSFEEFLNQRFGIKVTHGISEEALQKELTKLQKRTDLPKAKEYPE